MVPSAEIDGGRFDTIESLRPKPLHFFKGDKKMRVITFETYVKISTGGLLPLFAGG